MISLSEGEVNADESAKGRVDLPANPLDRIEACSMNAVAAGRAPRRMISRLDFLSFDPEEAHPAEDNESSALNPMAGLREEIEILRARLAAGEQELSQLLENARENAKLDAQMEWEQKLEQRLTEEQRRVSEIVEQFGQQRTSYFAGAEAEVVKLALEIATRVLHRETKMDPLLLAGVARIALDKIASDSHVTMRVPAAELPLWHRAFEDERSTDLQIVGDERMQTGECVIDTNVGQVDLGVSAQLDEIERGFFELLRRRPA